MTGATPSAGRVLVVNAGSSSLKLSVLDPAGAVTASADLPAPLGPAPRGAADGSEIKSAIDSLGAVDAVGHRIVHGGTLYAGPVRIDEQVRQRLESLTDLAPLHQPKSLAALDAVQAVLPTVPAVACFDTAFHATIPAAAATFALPRSGGRAGACVASGFTGCRTRTSRGAPRNSWDATPSASGSSPATSAPALPGRDPRRQVGRHHNGVHATGRPGDGDQIGIG